MIPRLVNSAWAASLRRTERAYRAALRRPGPTQAALLRSILATNADTVFGRDHDFGNIQTLEDFRRRVPVGDYASHEHDIERIRAGETNVLTRDAVTHLIPTSGSSGSRKLIPHTKALQVQFDAALGPWVRDLFRRYPGAAAGRAYWSVSPAIASDLESALPIGFQDDTDYLGPLGRRLVRRILAVPSDVRHIRDTQSFWFATATHLLAARDLSLISVWHPSYLACLLDVLASQWGALLDALPAREARRLRGIPSDAYRDIWPRLSLISVWADASARLPFDRIRERMPGVRFQPKGLLATEGWTTIPYRGAHPIAVTAHFFEFVDEDEAIHGCDELVEGRTYEILITTAGGLYRYRTGDRVRITGRIEATPTLAFLGRDSATSDLCGEKLHESHVTECLKQVFDALDYAPRDQLLQPVERATPMRYRLHLEASHPPPDDAEERIDRALRSNPHYALARRLGQLDRVQIRWQATPFRALASQTGAGLGDVKPSHLASSAQAT